MRRVWLVLVTGLAAGCSNGLAVRQSELAQWVGQPEVQLVAAMGAPNRTYDSGGMKFLTYEEPVQVEQAPYYAGSPYYLGAGPTYGFGGRVTTYVCDTTFTVAGGVVKGFSLRGDGCG
jgi:hypothetical protein